MTLSIFNYNTGNSFTDSLLSILTVCFIIGAIPAIFKYLASRIGSSDKQNWTKTSNPVENYETEMSKYFYTKEVRFRVLVRTLPIQSLLIIGFILMLIGTSIDHENTFNVGATMFLLFFVVYGVQFYRNGGWHNAGMAFDKYAAKYKPREYVTETHYEWEEGREHDKRIIGEYTYDKNAFENFITFLLNLPILAIKLSMSVTYIILFITDDLIMTVKYTVFYAFQKKASRKRAIRHYEELIEYSAKNGILIPQRIYENEDMNKIPYEINARYLEASYQSVKRGDESFLLFITDSSDPTHYLTCNVIKKITSAEILENKTLYVYETESSRIYISIVTSTHDTSSEGFLPLVIPFELSSDWQEPGTLSEDIIQIYEGAQSVYLRHMIENESPDTEVNIAVFDRENGTGVSASVKLSNIVLGEGDERFTYQITNFTPLCSAGIGTDARNNDSDYGHESDDYSHGDDGYDDDYGRRDYGNSTEHDRGASRPEQFTNPPKKSSVLFGLVKFAAIILSIYQIVRYIASLSSATLDTVKIPYTALLLFGAVMLISAFQKSARMIYGKGLPMWRKTGVFIFNLLFFAFPFALVSLYVFLIKPVYLEAYNHIDMLSSFELQLLSALESFGEHLGTLVQNGQTLFAALTIASPIIIWGVLSLIPKLFAKEINKKRK